MRLYGLQSSERSSHHLQDKESLVPKRILRLCPSSPPPLMICCTRINGPDNCQGDESIRKAWCTLEDEVAHIANGQSTRAAALVHVDRWPCPNSPIARNTQEFTNHIRFKASCSVFNLVALSYPCLHQPVTIHLHLLPLGGAPPSSSATAYFRNRTSVTHSQKKADSSTNAAESHFTSHPQ